MLTIAELALVFVLSSRVQTMSVGAARATFFGYALLNGMAVSYTHLDVYKRQTWSTTDTGSMRSRTLQSPAMRAGTTLSLIHISSTVEMPPAALTLQRPCTPLTISSTSWKLAPAVEKPVLVLICLLYTSRCV